MRYTAFAVAAVFALSAAETQAQSPEPTPTPKPAARRVPCSSLIYRQFDFWIGQWDVVNPAGKFVGLNRVERAGDCFLQENWAAATGGYHGRSLNSVAPDGKWHQTWTDSSGLRLELSGGLVGGKMVMEGDTPSFDPRIPGPTRNRITWSPEAGGVVRQHWETSTDLGTTWVTSFDGQYHPASSDLAIPDGFLRKLGGSWIGSGVVMRRDSHVELRVERGPGSMARLHWRNVMGGPQRDVFEGSAVYETRSGTEYAATWWDSQGARHAIVARVAEDGASMTALWGGAGQTVYSLLESGELEVVDSLKRSDGTWSEFGRTRLRRQ